MPYKFPTFDEIPYPELLDFTNISDITPNNSYCDYVEGCRNCIFSMLGGGCATMSDSYKPNRIQLLQYVKRHNPEYLI